MGLYNFQPRFVPFILDGSKTHTIRAERVNQDRPGSIMHLYTGLRHPGARLLMRCPCVKVERISITVEPRIHLESTREGPIEARWLDPEECDLLAWRDGFRPITGSAFGTMMYFWAGRLPFRGHIYHWDPNVKLASLRFSKGYGRQNP